MSRIAQVLAGSILMTVFLATPVLAQTFPPSPIDEPIVGVSDSKVLPCDMITIGPNYDPSSTVDINLDGVVIATATVGADGIFSVSVKIPCDTAPGTHFLGAGVAKTQISVLAAGDRGGEPGTGANLGAAILILAALLVAGVTVLMLTLRRVKVAQSQPVAE
jgi:hypothetical protein